MSDPAFNEPKLAINRIYTRVGDGGETYLVGGQKVTKDSARLESYGTVDELNAFVGQAAASLAQLTGAHPPLERLLRILSRVQHELFNLGSILATLPEDVHPKQPRITAGEIEQLEREIDEANQSLPPLRSFVLPGGARLNAELHICRTVCRRAERLAVALSRQADIDAVNIRYLNRLSDAFFVWSRWANVIMGVEETLWQPNQAASARPAD
jgi:cob(I)alamin adenosyltransferase